MSRFVRGRGGGIFFRTIFNNHLLKSRIMASAEVSKRLESKATAAEQIIAMLKSELEELKKNRKDLVSGDQARELALENELLRNEIERYKNELIRLESNRGIPQIPTPTTPEAKSSPAPETITPVIDAILPRNGKKPEPRKKKEGKEAKPKAAVESQEPPIDVGRLDFRVGKIVKAEKHPDADTLYVEEIDIGEEKNRTVVSGLVKYVPIDDLRDRMVIVLCNLKPSKMRGVTSEAMVMCASSPDKVEILVPPAGAAPGDLVHVEGYPRVPDGMINPKKKIFETCAPDLMTDDNGQAVYKNTPLQVPGKGIVLAPTLKRVAVK